MITLHQFHPCWNLSSGSPFCIKLETHFKMLGIEYINDFIDDPRIAPKNKLPFISWDGQTLGDSALIIDHLKETRGADLDSHLSTEQVAIAHTLTHLFEDYLYWVIVYSRWAESTNWPLTKAAYFVRMPPIIRSIVPELIRKGPVKALKAHGLGRHSRDEIYAMASNSVDAIAEILSDKTYFFNDKVSGIDAVCYAFITSIITPPIDSPLKEHTLAKKSLVHHSQHIQRTYFCN